MLVEIVPEAEISPEERLEDSWDFKMNLPLRTDQLKNNKELGDEANIKEDFYNLFAKKNNNIDILATFARKIQPLISKNVKARAAKSTPRKTLYEKGKRPRKVENRLLLMKGESRVKKKSRRDFSKTTKWKKREYTLPVTRLLHSQSSKAFAEFRYVDSDLISQSSGGRFKLGSTLFL